MTSKNVNLKSVYIFRITYIAWIQVKNIELAATTPYHIRIKDNMWFKKPNGERLKMS
jgi:hypothetical protein